ncbi:MAG: hypothetical protein ACU0FT_11835, partial [Paracoccus sp. (in: a-proteobacteria)]
VMPAGHTAEQRRQKYAFDEIGARPSGIVYHSDREAAIGDDQIWALLMRDGVLPESVVARLVTAGTVPQLETL